MTLRVLGRGPDLLLERDPRRVGVDGGPAPVTPKMIESGPGRCPSCPGRRRTRSAAGRAPPAAGRRRAPSTDPDRWPGSSGGSPGRSAPRPPESTARALSRWPWASSTITFCSTSSIGRARARGPDPRPNPPSGTAAGSERYRPVGRGVAAAGVQQRGAGEPGGGAVPPAEIGLDVRQRRQQAGVVGGEPDALLVLGGARAVDRAHVTWYAPRARYTSGPRDSGVAPARPTAGPARPARGPGRRCRRGGSARGTDGPTRGRRWNRARRRFW